MSNPRIVYRPNTAASPETELHTLAHVYHFILDCRAQKGTAEHAPEPNSRNDKENLLNERRRSK